MLLGLKVLSTTPTQVRAEIRGSGVSGGVSVWQVLMWGRRGFKVAESGSEESHTSGETIG